MSGGSSSADQYGQALARLAEHARRRAEAEEELSPTPTSQALKKALQQTEELRLSLENSTVRDELEAALFVLQGERESAQWTAYNTLVLQLVDLEQAARAARALLPNSRERFVAKWVASVFVHLRYQCGMPRPKTTEVGPDVEELASLLRKAGLTSTEAATHGLLRRALRTFDRFMPPDCLDEILG